MLTVARVVPRPDIGLLGHTCMVTLNILWQVLSFGLTARVIWNTLPRSNRSGLEQTSLWVLLIANEWTAQCIVQLERCKVGQTLCKSI